jgi:perosamine synthetase
MNRKFIQHNKPTIGKIESDAVKRVIDSCWIAQGQEVRAFEKELAKIHGVRPEHVIATSSGSAALYLALMGLDVIGKRVAIPVYSCSSLENAVLLAGGTPVYFDVVPGSVEFNLPSEYSFDFMINPHLFGIPTRIPERLKDVTIEDCAQSIGAKIDGLYVGTQASISTFSFYATKLLTTAGQGGGVICRELSVANRLRDFLAFDCKVDGKLRFNLQMTDIQAAMGLAQLSRYFNEFIDKRNYIFSQYKKIGVPMLDSKDKNINPVRFRAILKCQDSRVQKKIMKILSEHNIGSIVPIEKTEILNSKWFRYEGAEYNADHFLSIPCYPKLSDEELTFISRVIEGV